MGSDINAVVTRHGLKPGQAVMVLLLDPEEVGDIDYEMYHRTSEDHYDIDFHENKNQIDAVFKNVLFRIVSNKIDPDTVFAERLAEFEIKKEREKKRQKKERGKTKKQAKKPGKFQSFARHIRTLVQPVRNWIASIILLFKAPGQ